MKTRNFRNSFFEDKTIEKAVDLSVSTFENEIREIIDDEFEKYLAAWPLKTAFYDSVEGGKRLRAFSTLVFYNLCGGSSNNVKKLSAAMELIHCASLVLDDELDKRTVRPDRNLPTIRGKYSPEEAMLVVALNVLYSTDLLVEAIANFELEKRIKAREFFVRTVSEGGLGEILKWKFIQKRKIPSKNTYWKNLIQSSGALFFQMSCGMGAIAATDNEKLINKVKLIGYRLGELLQGGDDLKDLKEDMRDGFYSLGVINYYDSLKGVDKKALRETLESGLSERNLDNIFKDIIYSKSMKKTLRELQEKGNEIISLLDTFEDSKDKRLMIKVINYLKNRMKITQ